MAFTKRYILLWLSLSVLLVSCSTGNKFASSFSKRKYTKGYFVDVPTSCTHVITNTSLASKPKPAPILPAPAITEPTYTTLAAKSIIREVNKIVVSQVSHPALSIKHIFQTEVISDEVDSTSTKNSDRFKETNWVAVTGCVISIAGIILTVPTTALTLLAGIVLGIGVLVCIYSLYLNKIYLNWTAVLGLSLTILLLALLLL